MKIQELFMQTKASLTEGKVKDAMMDLLDAAIKKVEQHSDLNPDDDMHEFCTAVAKQMINMDKMELFAGSKAEAYEWVKDYIQGL